MGQAGAGAGGGLSFPETDSTWCGPGDPREDVPLGTGPPVSREGTSARPELLPSRGSWKISVWLGRGPREPCDAVGHGGKGPPGLRGCPCVPSPLSFWWERGPLASREGDGASRGDR